MLEFRGDAPGFDASFFGEARIEDSRGQLANVREMRMVPVPGGMRVFALTRRFEPGARLVDAGRLPANLVGSVPERFVPGYSLGRPCWVPGSGCGKRAVNPLLPPVS